MHPSEKETLAPMELPSVEHTETPDTSKQQGSERNPEFLPPQTTGAAQPQGQMPATGVANQVAPSLPLATSTPPVSNSSQMALQTPQIADDADLIEKEWVEKAKEIVEKTKENPYLQNKAISEIKADYIKKRYNKDIAKSKE